MPPSQTKASHYIDLLENARCSGDWQSVPELVRKIRKHAPERSCLTLTAENECAISKATTTSISPGSASDQQDGLSRSNNLDLSEQIPKLQNERDAESAYPEDKFQAQVCIGWMQWVVAEYDAALGSLPASLDVQVTGIEPTDTASEWTTVCILKAAYLKANCLTRARQRREALAVLHSALPALARIWEGKGVRSQTSYWTELFLTEYCVVASDSVRADETTLDETNSLACFRSWSRYWENSKSSVTGGYSFKGAGPRRRIWSEYYLALTRIVEEDLPYPIGYLSTVAIEASARTQLCTELKSVEAHYKTLLLTETSFPKADESRDEVESFVKALMQNWFILCGRGWREYDLGPGGRNSFTRGVLDTLYSAATKTYHSVTILRSLFVAHLSVAEFDLAFKAFDSYLALVKKAKARVDKTGEKEPSLDDDGTILETISQCVIALCRYGHKGSAEKARQLAAELEDWLSKLPQLKSADGATPAIPEVEDRATSALFPPVPPHVIALSWQAIGLAHGHWSRVTHEASSRTEIQAKAIRCLRKSLAAEYGRSKDVRSYFALALMLAERRELTTAIEVVKTALMTTQGQEEDYHLTYGQYWQERSLIPMWHLLALLLSARQDFVMAAKACEGALEQFKDPTVLFGKSSPGFKSDHLNEVEHSGEANTGSRGLVDEMDDTEKEGILEVKMTQLALVELVDGPDVAVNASYELLTLFSRLFGYVAAQPVLNAHQQAKQPPRTSGTLRSIKGSIFGSRADRSRLPTRQPSTATMSDKASTAGPTARPATAHTTGSAAPAIQVTADQGRPSTASAARSDSKRRNSLRKGRSSSRKRASSGAGGPPPAFSAQSTVLDETPYFTPAADAEQQNDFFSVNKRSTSRSSSGSRGRPMPSLNSYLSSASKTSEFSELAPEGTTLASSNDLLPLIQYSKDKEKMRRATILIRLWLMIAGLYRRAGMFDDGKGAVNEAQKLVQALETESVREPAGSAGVKGPGWAESKSVDDLWGDIYAEHGLLGLACDGAFAAREDFESALTHCPDHPVAIVGLSNILLDIYSEQILPPPSVPGLPDADPALLTTTKTDKTSASIPSAPLGLGPTTISTLATTPEPVDNQTTLRSQLPSPYKATALPLVDRLAARDRAYALLTGLTRRGDGWNRSDAWFALARAYEESGQPDKAKEVLWWCVELEEATGVREWRCVGGSGGYTL
ncbi:hypothetical protein NLU13_2764 [Sarocladium strictum]|uniref:Filamentation protein n=1 Tax=Sarocladium strictum TaxID=5046 RepID=A0AA39GLL0_SARSR|nr:hypothetical protein NLU13_2764 [Sarocladium strictum]